MMPLQLERPTFLPFEGQAGAPSPLGTIPTLDISRAGHDLRLRPGTDGWPSVVCRSCLVELQVPGLASAHSQSAMIDLFSDAIQAHLQPPPVTLAELTDLGYFDSEAS